MATSEPYFGAEVVDRESEAGTVTENRAATCYLTGTAPIHEVHDTAEKRAAFINTDIIIRQRADIEAAFGPARAGYTIPQALDAVFDQAEETGIGTIVVNNVFDPDVHKDGEDAPDTTQVTNLDITGAIDAAGNASGLKRIYGCYQRFGWFPKIFLTPGYNLATGVKAELDVIAHRVRGRALLDAPLGATLQQLIEARGAEGPFDFQTDSRRLIGCWPHMTALDTDTTSATAGEAIAEPYSPRFAGVWLRTIMEHGYHHSPSNRPIRGQEGAAQDVLYVPGDASSDVQFARGAGVVTCEARYGKDEHTSGNRSLAYPTDSDPRNFMHVQFIEDMLDETVLLYLDDRLKDRNATPAKLTMIEDDINAYLDSKSAGEDPALYGGEFWFDRALTTPRSVLDGHVFYQESYAPVGVAERITVTRGIDLNLIANALGLSQTGYDIAA